ncbi:MAG: His/Gly/Thr/Pro-type tRNA ligase C-terminal domain-containing protein [bacterium]|nr:His/Gly/Thr/Pro-type tRNA ligase C-terminal domain-containing protein [bacterium]
MKYSSYFLKTHKDAKAFDSINATLLQKGGFIDQVMSGVYTMLPIGLKTLTNIETIVREEMNKIASELLMPALSPTELWETTGRTGIDVLFEARGANDASRKRNDGQYILNSTHEELITPLAQKNRQSYKDFPFAVYQIQTKFRNEERAKSGLMRGREFRMKDMYSFHTSEEDLLAFYETAKQAYMNIFSRLGIGEDTKITKASGGDFTTGFSHEFQTMCESGEDVIYINDETGEAWNKEVAPSEEGFTKHNASEVGNIFPLNTKFSKAFDYSYTDASGKKQLVFMGSYGIGTSRLMGVIVEKFHDDKGIIWPESVAPFTVYLASLNRDDSATVATADAVYEELTRAGIETLYDDRDTGTGAKFADADLLGIPYRVVVSKKTGENVEVASRRTGEAKTQSLATFIQEIR